MSQKACHPLMLMYVLRLSLLLFFLSAAQIVFAQQRLFTNQQHFGYVKSPVANTTNIEDENSGSKTDDGANAAIVSKFSTLIPSATNLKWTNSADNFLVSFLIKGRKGNAGFTAKAELNYAITDCNVEQLPVAFSKTIKIDYAFYHLFNAKKITAYKTVAYQEILEDSKGFITLKYTSEGVEEVQQVKKQ